LIFTPGRSKKTDLVILTETHSTDALMKFEMGSLGWTSLWTSYVNNNQNNSDKKVSLYKKLVEEPLFVKLLIVLNVVGLSVVKFDIYSTAKFLFCHGG
jgi:hypothetical protein